MRLNVNTYVPTASRVSTPRHFPHSLNGSPIASCSSKSCLGIHITFNLSWAIHTKHTISRANRTLGFLKRSLKLATLPLELLACKSESKLN